MELNKYIDHTLLKPDATKEQIQQLCEEAKQYHFMSVCVNPCWVEFCKEQLKDTDVKVCTVIGFPLGATTSEIKGFEAFEAQKHGADEIDMVMNIGKFKDGDDDYVIKEIRDVKNAIGHDILKVIIEICLLTDEEIVRACKDALEGGAHFVKTSTGFSTGGATVEAVKLMKETVGGRASVKASGGIRTKKDMDAMIEAGAERIGTSSGVKLMQGVE